MTYGNARSFLNTSGFGNPSTPTETSRTSCPLTERSFIACHHVSLRLRDLQSLPFVLFCFFGVHFTSVCYLSFSFLFNKKLLTRDNRYLKKKVYSHRFVQLDCLCAFGRTGYAIRCVAVWLWVSMQQKTLSSQEIIQKIESDDRLS